MTTSNEAARGVHRRQVHIWPAVASVLVVIALAPLWDRQASGQTPAPQALGPYAADFLLRTGGELDGAGSTGAGARSLATGSTITTASTCFAAWCGTQTVVEPVLLPAYQWHRNNVLYTIPAVGGDNYWYGPDAQGYYFLVRNVGHVSNPETQSPTPKACFPGGVVYGTFPYSTPYVSALWRSSAAGSFGPFTWTAGQDVSCSGLEGDVQAMFTQFRGSGGVNPSAPPTQQDANTWVQTQIDGGRWADVVKPALDAVIRPAVNSADLQTLGITGSPPFDTPPQVRRIAIDAGHADLPEACRGNTGPNWNQREDVLVLEIAQQVMADFSARGHDVVWTRPTTCEIEQKDDGTWGESDKSLGDRARTATREKALILVSIHLNGSTVAQPRGTEVWYDPRRTATAGGSLDLARRLVNYQVALPLPKRPPGVSGEDGIKLADYPPQGDQWPYVILSVASRSIPAVIDEVAFLNNGGPSGDSQDECLLSQQASCDPSQNFRLRVANAIENAIRSYFP